MIYIDVYFRLCFLPAFNSMFACLLPMKEATLHRVPQKRMAGEVRSSSNKLMSIVRGFRDSDPSNTLPPLLMILSLNREVY